MIVNREVLTHLAIRPYRSDNHRSRFDFVPPSDGGERVKLLRCLLPIEHEAAGPAQEVDPHGLTERLPMDEEFQASHRHGGALCQGSLQP